MSNKTELQARNTDYATLIESLRGKAVGGGSETSKKTVTITVAGPYSNYACYLTEDGTPKRVVSGGETIEALGGALLLSASSSCSMQIISGKGYVMGVSNSGTSSPIITTAASMPHIMCVCIEDGTIVNVSTGSAGSG